MRLGGQDKQALEALIDDALKRELLRGFSDCEISVKPAQVHGASGASTFEADAELHFFVKLNLNPHQAARERDGYDLLVNTSSDAFQAHLVPPLVRAAGFPVMMFPLLGTHHQTLHDWVSGSASARRKVDLYTSILDTFLRELWQPSATNEPVNLARQYRERVHDRIRKIAEHFGAHDYRKLKVRVNGRSPVDIAEIIHEIDEMATALELRPSYTIHADEHARNIVVDPQDHWFVVDFASAMDRADWVYSVAKMLHWWRIYYPLEVASHDAAARKALGSRCSLSKDGEVLSVRYNEAALASGFHAICKDMERVVMEFAERAGAALNDDAWRKRLGVAYFSVVIGNIAALLANPAMRFVAPPMLHDAVRFFSGDTSLRAA